MTQKNSPALLMEMLRSFTSLARTLNLSRTVRELGSTRQTVRRHIALLEELKGEILFCLDDRQYQLTEAGRRALAGAQELIARADAWVNNEAVRVDGLLHLMTEEAELSFHLQQHPISKIWSNGSHLMRFALDRWVAGEGQIQCPEFAPLRPYLILFRRLVDDWVCIDIGEKSAFATWMGWKWERSSLGTRARDLPVGPSFASLLEEPFQDVMNSHGLRLDHIYTHMKRPGADKPTPISYQRLLMGCQLPDGSFALALLVDRTHAVEIESVPPDVLRSMPEEFVMDVTAEELAAFHTSEPSL